MTLTENYTYQLGNEGVILNTDSLSLPFVDVTNIQGLDSAPLRVTQRQREGMDGGFTDAQWENQRTIIINGTVYANVASIEQYLDVLKENYEPIKDPIPFYFQHPGVGTRFVLAKPITGIKCDTDTLRRTGMGALQIQLVAEDPSIYGSPISFGPVGIVIPSSGRGYNRSYNYGYGGTIGSGGSVSLFNPGNRPTNAIIRLQNVLDPVVVNDTTGERLIFDLDITGTDYLDIDLRNRKVILNDSANRRGSLLGGSTWFMIDKKTPITLRLIGTAPASGTPSMTGTYWPAYR